jgi:hypothetical protein
MSSGQALGLLPLDAGGRGGQGTTAGGQALGVGGRGGILPLDARREVV